MMINNRKNKPPTFFILLLLLGLVICSFSQNVVIGEIETKNFNKIKSNIIVPKKNSFNLYRYVETFDSVMGTKKLYPDQIEGYVINNESYKSILIPDSASNTVYKVFAKIITKGYVTLLYTPVVEEKFINIYFFKKHYEDKYRVFREGEVVDLGMGPYRLYVFNEEYVFLSFFEWYFGDCQKITRGLKSRKYVIGDIENLFKDFNACFD